MLLKMNGLLDIKNLTSQKYIVNVTSYNVSSNDSLILVDYTATGSCSINLFSCSLGNYHLIICDGGGNASKNNITINSNGTDKICGESSTKINENYNSLHLFSDGISKWYII